MTRKRDVRNRALCPTPDKIRHKNRSQATAALTSLRATPGVRKAAYLHVYRCWCGYWHVGHAAEPRKATR